VTGAAGGPAGGGADCRPISWLRLERYCLGELPAADHQTVADHLAGCERCHRCVEQIRSAAPAELPPLPALPASPPAGGAPRERRARSGRWWALGFGLAGALAAGWLVLLPPRPTDDRGPLARRIRIKGGEVTFELVRSRNGSSAYEPTSFAAADRFKVLLTCPPPLGVHVDLAIFQGGTASFPGPPAAISCGSRVPLAPAFQITGAGPATVCVAVDTSRPPARARWAAGPPTGSEPPAACVRLDPAGD
jgi:hypothetical protein